MSTIKIIHRLTLAISLLLSARLLNAQAIKGRVTDAATGRPVFGASVYLNGTYLGTSTDSTGNFSLPALQTSSPLMVSYIGYESQSISNYTGRDLIIALKHKTNTLKEVTIVVDEMSREKKMKIFLTEFIGSTNKDCVIGNPDDIWLHYNKKTEELTAGSDKPLLIRNKKLGYNITYFLANFKHNESRTSYAGNYFFAEDTAGLKPDEIKKILKARDDAYFGSRMHFIRSLWADNLGRSKYQILQPVSTEPRLVTYNYKKSKKLQYKDVVDTRDTLKFITLTTEVSMVYEKKGKGKIESFLKLEDNLVEPLIDSKGFYDQGLVWNGDMGIARVNKLLPFEFQPANP